MKASRFLSLLPRHSPRGPIRPLLLAAVLLTPAAAQTTNAPHVIDVPQPPQPGDAATNPQDTLSPDKVEAYKQRFGHGMDLAQAGKLAEARQVFEGILAEQPNARGSLLEAGKISFALGDLAKANNYIAKLHELEPDYPEALELLARDFKTLHDSGKVPNLQQSLCFVRERIPFHDDTIVVSQFFDYTTDPNTVWMGEVFDHAGKLTDRLLLNYDPDATQALRAKDPKYGHTEVFTWFDHEIQDGRVARIKAYLQIFALPDYAKFRSAMLLILANPPKPIYSADVPAGSQTP